MPLIWKKEIFFQKIESKKEIVTIADLIATERTVPEKYQKLILEQKEYSGNYPTSHSLIWEDWAEENETSFIKPDVDFLKKYLSNDTLVDLGAGRAKIIEKLCKKIGAKTYVGVDQFFQLQQPQNLKETAIVFDETNADDLHVINAESDMLNFITLMPDNSGNFILNGIDGYVIKSEEYQLALCEELVRATRSNGIIFGLNSEDIEYHLKVMANQENSLLSKLDLSQFRFPPGTFFYTKK